MEKKEGLIEVRMFLTSIALLAVLIILAGLSSYFVSPGKLTTVMKDGEKQRIYQVIEQEPVPVWKIVASPLLSVTGTNGPKIIVLILFIFIIGGSFAILNRSGVLPGIVTDLGQRFSDRKRLFLIVNVILFSVLGSCLGIIEEIVPMVLIFVPLAYRMGWDSMTGIAIPFLSAGFGFAAATFNPFTIGTAQKLADVALFSGLSLRLPFFLLSTLSVILFLSRYTRRIEKDPQKSLTYEMDQRIKAKLDFSVEETDGVSNKGSLIWMGGCFSLIACVVLGGSAVSFLREMAFPLIAIIFLMMGWGVGFLSGSRPKVIMGYFVRGLIDFSPAIVLILMASAVGYLIQEGNILDTLLFHLSNAAQEFSEGTAVLLIYGFQMVMNALVPSGTGQAVLTIPILAPLGDMLGITRQTVVLAFQFGDGFSNLLWPTNPMLLIAIGLARVNYREWFRWILPIQCVLFLFCCAFLLIAVNVGYT